jgi:hypothetical protein
MVGSVTIKFIVLGTIQSAKSDTQKMKSSVCWSSLSTTYSSSSEFFNKSFTSPWEPTVPLFFADLFLYSDDAEFIPKLNQNKKITEVKAFNLTFRYIDDVLSINNPNFTNWIPLIFPKELR